MENTEQRLLQIEDKIIEIRNQKVILDCDVAELYSVQTKEINQAVKNNPEKFPKGFVFELSDLEVDSSRLQFLTLQNSKSDLRSKFLTAKISSKTRVLPKAFTEQGLYMLATILKSPRATQTTLAIVKTFAKIRELSRNIVAIQDTTDEVVHRSLLQKSGQIINDILFPNIPIGSSETSVELNLGLMKVKHAVKSGNSNYENDLHEIKQMLDRLLGANPEKAKI